MLLSTVHSSTSARCRFRSSLRCVSVVLALVLVAGHGVGCRQQVAGDRQLLIVHAASSLTEAFQELKREFERSHPLTEVSLVFSGSQVLRLQIEQGAAADILATANQQHTEILVEAGLVKNPLVFAHNELVLIVPHDNPAGIESFEDLPKAQRLVVGTDQVPVGQYTRQMLLKAADRLGMQFTRQVQSRVVSLESNARLVRAKVELGEADAALVYRTDAAISDRVRSIPIPAEINVQARYFIGELAASEGQQVVRDWIAFALSPAGQAILIRHGFVEG